MSEKETEGMADLPNSQRTKVLVTGASGFLASHVIQCLLDHDYMVRGTVRSLSNQGKVQPLRDLFPEVELVEADLTSDKGWKEAVVGCRDVIHVASPVPDRAPRDPDDVIRPAVDGTLRVLRVCLGTVRRVVVTSSGMAIHGEADGTDRVFTEDDWTDPASPHLNVYSRSKVLAERAAWDFVAEHPGCFELVTIQPTMMQGPILLPSINITTQLIKRLIDGSMPMYPHLNFPFGDVRDAALAHVNALETKEAAGHRHIITARSIWVREIVEILKEELEPLGYSIPGIRSPRFLIWLASFFDETAKEALPWLGRTLCLKNDRMRNVLGLQPRDVRGTILDTAHSLIKLGIVKKTSKYQEKYETSTNK